METLAKFVERLHRDVDYYCHKWPRSEGYSLKKRDTMDKNQMGVFAYVDAPKREGVFRVSVDQNLADAQAIADADCVKPCGNWRNTALFYKVRPGSSGKDYRKAVRALGVVAQKKR